MLYIITVETTCFIDGKETTSLEKTGVLSADSRWDALKTAKAVAKAVARDHWVLSDDHSFFWETTSGKSRYMQYLITSFYVNS